jgi:hypothetical protein
MKQAILRSYFNPKINASEELAKEYPAVLKCSKKNTRSKIMKIKKVSPVRNVHLVSGDIFIVM